MLAALLPATLKLKALVPLMVMLPPSCWLSLVRFSVNDPLLAVYVPEKLLADPTLLVATQLKVPSACSVSCTVAPLPSVAVQFPTCAGV